MVVVVFSEVILGCYYYIKAVGLTVLNGIAAVEGLL